MTRWGLVQPLTDMEAAESPAFITALGTSLLVDNARRAGHTIDRSTIKIRVNESHIRTWTDPDTGEEFETPRWALLAEGQVKAFL